MSLGYTGMGEIFPGVASACMPILLPEGLLVGPNSTSILGNHTYFLSPYCPQTSLYIYDLSRIFETDTHILTASTQAWKNVYLHHDGYGSSLPVFISVVAFALGIVTSLTAFMTMSRHSRFPIQLRVAVYYACAEVAAMFGIVLHFMHARYHEGGNSVALLVSYMLVPRHQIPAYIASIMLLFSMARVSERLFERRVERRVVRMIAPIFVTLSVVITGINLFAPFVNPIIGALRYLFELSVYLLYSICLCLRAGECWQAAFSLELYPLTLLSIVVSFVPCVLYIADAYGWWQARIIDELCPFTAVACVVTGWYWVQKLGDIQQGIATERHLGRRIYGHIAAGGDVEDAKTRLLHRALAGFRG